MEGGDREALARRLVETYSDQLLRLAYSLLNNVPDAQDVCQEALLKGLDHAGSFGSREHERAWLMRVTVNLCKNLRRSPWRTRRAPAEALEGLRTEAPEPGDDTVARAVQALPPKYREVVILYYYQEWKAWEIAQRLHLSVSTVTVRLSRARAMLREQLKGWYDDGEE